DFFPCLSNTPDRGQYLLFTAPYLTYPVVIITRENVPDIHNINDLAGKRVAVVKHLFVYGTLKREYSHLKLNYRYSNTVDENLDAVSLGRADACFVNLAAASYFIHKKGLTNLRIAAPIDWDGVSLSMGVRKDWPLFRSIIEKALSSISQEERDEISQKWIRVDLASGTPREVVWKWGGAAALVFVMMFSFFFIWNQRLKKEIRAKEAVETALNQNRKKLTTLIGNLPGVAYRCVNDENWTMLYLSDGCYDLTGYHPSELVGSTRVSWSDLIVQEDRPLIWDDVQNGVDNDRSFTLEYRIRHRDGSERWVWEKGMPQGRDEKGRKILEGFINDISDLKQAEMKRKSLESQLRHAHKMEAIGTLAGGIAHEFNNILGIVLGNSELALDDVPDGHPAAASLEEIRTASIRGKDVVRQLLSFSRDSAFEKRTVDMGDLVTDTLGFLKASIPSDIQFSKMIAPDVCPVTADPSQIRQVSVNLCTNAAQAMSPEGGFIDIRVENVRIESQKVFADQLILPGRYVKLVITDSGSGIPNHVLNKVFHPFYTTREVNEGAGMGLSVAHGIMKNHDGFISIQSRPGRGTEISCLFPPEKAHPPSDTAGSSTPKTLQPPSGGANKKSILLVDDESALAAMGKKQLERQGYRISVFTNPVEAVDAFRADPGAWDLVMTDYSMPVMNGSQVIHHVKAQRPGIPVILCSGHDPSITPSSLRDMGADHYLMKPAESDVLARTVRDALQKKEKQMSENGGGMAPIK
ncbi:MAG: transporter substrate-binding domain-containing protein, partial [Desulfobacterales bacterium]|nr:transporter substrate-binding domain-containing protein [Desulfobacterales bacterium]